MTAQNTAQAGEAQLQNASTGIDKNIVQGVVSLEDVFQNLDASVERYTKMELYQHIQLVTGPEVLKFGGPLQKVVAKGCKIQARYVRTYWKARGQQQVKDSL
jgi:hypothetical protein